MVYGWSLIIGSPSRLTTKRQTNTSRKHIYTDLDLEIAAERRLEDVEQRFEGSVGVEESLPGVVRPRRQVAQDVTHPHDDILRTSKYNELYDRLLNDL